MLSAFRDVPAVETAADVGKRVVAVVDSISAVKVQSALYTRRYLKKLYT